MIIRSQDKHGFVNLGNIDTVCMDAEWNIYAFNGKANSLIGTYSTEEKAIKVLDMIAQNYVESEKYIIRRVFEMPQDSEV